MAITVTISNGIQISGNPIWVNLEGAAPPVGATMHRHILKIESNDGKLTGAPFYDAIAPNALFESKFNIQGYIDQPVANIFEWPVANANIERTNSTFSVKITAGDSYIDSTGQLVEAWNASGTDIIVLKGGVSQRQVSIWYASGASFYSTYIAAKKFLTQRPQDDFCHPSQPVKLWFFNENFTVNKIRFVCNYADAGQVTTNITITQSSNKLYELNVNPYHNGLSMVNVAGAKLLNWTVTLYNDATPVSDTRHFQYDYRYCERPFWLMFANSLGGIDDIYLSGSATEGFETQSTEVYKPAAEDATVFDRTLITPNKTGRNSWNISSGYKSATQILHLRDLLLSREAWLIYPNNVVTNYYVIPVNINKSSAKLVNRAEDLHSITIEMQEAHNSRFSFDNRLY